MNKTLLFTIDFPPNIGGVANYYQEICKHFSNDKIVVLAQRMNSRLYRNDIGISRNDDIVSGDDNGVSENDKVNFKIYRQNLITDLLIWPKWLPAFWYLYKIVKKEKIKNVLVGQGLPLGIVAYFLSKILKFDFFIFFHGLDIVTTRKIKRKKFIMKKIFKRTKSIIVNSNFTKNEVLRLGFDKNKIIVLYPCPFFNPPASENVKNELVKKYNLYDKKIILSVGRLIKRKGFDVVINSMEKILKEVNNAVYIIAGGSGEYSNKLKKIANNSLAKDNIIFLEDVKNEELKGLYSLCDIFIMPNRKIGSDVEGFGIVYLEANSFGKPVIGGKSGGVAEAIIDQKTGMLIDSNSRESVSGAVVKLLENNNLAKKLGTQGKKRIKDEFMWNKQVNKLKNIL